MEDDGKIQNFVLNLIEVAYRSMNWSLPSCCKQKDGDENCPQYKEICYPTIIDRAILKYLRENHESNETLEDILSEEYSAVIEELSKNYSPSKLLRFLALYSLKSGCEYYHRRVLDSPNKFLSSAVSLLEEFKKNIHGDKFWEDLDEVAENAMANEPDISTFQNLPLEDKEKEFELMANDVVITVMKCIHDFWCVETRDNLDFTFMHNGDSDRVYEQAIRKAHDDMQEVIKCIGSSNEPYVYYFTSAIINFKAESFLRFGVYCSMSVIHRYFSWEEAEGILKHVLLIAIRVGKFGTVKSFLEFFLEDAKFFLEMENREVAPSVEASLFESLSCSDSSSESSAAHSDFENMSSNENTHSASEPIFASSKGATSFIENIVNHNVSDKPTIEEIPSRVENVNAEADITETFEQGKREGFCKYCKKQ